MKRVNVSEWKMEQDEDAKTTCYNSVATAQQRQRIYKQADSYILIGLEIAAS